MNPQPITLPVAELKPALTGLGKIIVNKSTLPVLRSLKVERTSDGWICLTATDLDRFVTVRLEQPAKGEPFAILVPHEDLAKLTKSSNKGDCIHLEPGDKESVILRFNLGDQLGETKVQSFPLQEFPAIPRIQANPVPVSESFRLALHEAMACSSTDETRYVLNGACIDVSQPKAHYLVGTDGRHLFSCNSFNLPFQKSIIIPKHKFLGWKDFNLDGAWQTHHWERGGTETTSMLTTQKASDKQYIADGVEESLTLDYKAAGALHAQKKEEILKDVSAFDAMDLHRLFRHRRFPGRWCRSLGLSGSKVGVQPFSRTVRTWQILPEASSSMVCASITHERRGIFLSASTPFRARRTKEWLEQVISGIQPRVAGIVIHPVQLSSDVDHCCYVVEIPQSDTVHQAKDHRYYRRYNFENRAMEDFEVREAMSRTKHPKIEVLVHLNLHEPWEKSYFLVKLRNVSKRIAKDYMCTVNLPLTANGEAIRPEEPRIMDEDENGQSSIEFSLPHSLRTMRCANFLDHGLRDKPYEYREPQEALQQ